jgi:hypothetical protein
MYINPVAKQTPNTQSSQKRKKAGGDSSFAETVESLLELDAVDIASPNKRKEQRKEGFGQTPEEAEKELERKTLSSNPAPKKGSDRPLNIRA